MLKILKHQPYLKENALTSYSPIHFNLLSFLINLPKYIYNIISASSEENVGSNQTAPLHGLARRLMVALKLHSL